MSLYNDTGLFGFLFTIFEVAKGKEVVELCIEELRRIADNLPDGKIFISIIQICIDFHVFDWLVDNLTGFGAGT